MIRSMRRYCCTITIARDLFHQSQWLCRHSRHRQQLLPNSNSTISESTTQQQPACCVTVALLARRGFSSSLPSPPTSGGVFGQPTSATSGNGGTVISPTSSFYDPKTNEPAGLRAVLDGMKRMEQQMTNIENDVEGMKNMVKKIRESNGKCEHRLDVVEDYADTMQQDLYLTMDMIRLLNETLATRQNGPHWEQTNRMTLHTNTTPQNPNVVAASRHKASSSSSSSLSSSSSSSLSSSLNQNHRDAEDEESKDADRKDDERSRK